MTGVRRELPYVRILGAYELVKACGGPILPNICNLYGIMLEGILTDGIASFGR